MEQHITDTIIAIVKYNDSIGPLAGIILIILESIIPILPLSVFIALNVLTFGFLLGFIMSYLATLVGCLISFLLVRKVFKKRFERRVKEGSKAYKFMRRLSKIKFSNFVLIIALPFTPAFLINICSALSEMSLKKFMVSIIIGKLAIVYFWGFIGNSLIESITNPVVLLKIILLLIGSYIISKLVGKKFGIE